MPVFRQFRDFFCTIFGRYKPGAIFAHLSFTPAHKETQFPPAFSRFSGMSGLWILKSRCSAPAWRLFRPFCWHTPTSSIPGQNHALKVLYLFPRATHLGFGLRIVFFHYNLMVAPPVRLAVRGFFFVFRCFCV